MSQTLQVGNRSLQLDKHGYLENLDDWSPEVADALADTVLLTLSEEHWEVLHLLRAFHAEYGLTPGMRVLVKLMQKEYGPEKGNSIHLLRLFPGSPIKLSCLIAGLPRPVNCF